MPFFTFCAYKDLYFKKNTDICTAKHKSLCEATSKAGTNGYGNGIKDGCCK